MEFEVIFRTFWLSPRRISYKKCITPSYLTQRQKPCPSENFRFEFHYKYYNYDIRFSHLIWGHHIPNLAIKGNFSRWLPQSLPRINQMITSSIIKMITGRPETIKSNYIYLKIRNYRTKIVKNVYSKLATYSIAENKDNKFQQHKLMKETTNSNRGPQQRW